MVQTADSSRSAFFQGLLVSTPKVPIVDSGRFLHLLVANRSATTVDERLLLVLRSDLVLVARRAALD